MSSHQAPRVPPPSATDKASPLTPVGEDRAKQPPYTAPRALSMDDPIVRKGKELLRRGEGHDFKLSSLSEVTTKETDSVAEVERLLSSYGEMKKQDEETFRKLLASAGEADARIPTLRKQLSRLIE